MVDALRNHQSPASIVIRNSASANQATGVIPLPSVPSSQQNQLTSRVSMIEAGIRSAHSLMMDEDDIWSRYNNDKTDIEEHLAGVIRTLSAALLLNRKLRALSIGSSSEPLNTS
ncbi:hypothetical protein NY406_04250 [Chlorobaculum sp. MV4-Y]|uniref:hypothetical protein n=1 Tax=Chlorobaculum sp. MV4-Y TaxID=2976335 RepID=UPI0021AEAFCE|nr:hypothetical protein [Chlorobaculum sp. MV4-Y]UWX58482.1 hypothetical protein NY406_04250 [Chlorobaculum sp. MV4-Y]